jgi:hypothetical protein
VQVAAVRAQTAQLGKLAISISALRKLQGSKNATEDALGVASKTLGGPPTSLSQVSRVGQGH